jgi:hypothetical protein
MKIGLSHAPRLVPSPVADRRPKIEQSLAVMPKERLTVYFKANLLHKDDKAHLKATLALQLRVPFSPTKAPSSWWRGGLPEGRGSGMRPV